MDKKTKLFIVAQIVIIAVFAFLAVGCFGSSYTTDSYYDSYDYDNRSSSYSSSQYNQQSNNPPKEEKPWYQEKRERERMEGRGGW